MLEVTTDAADPGLGLRTRSIIDEEDVMTATIVQSIVAGSCISLNGGTRTVVMRPALMVIQLRTIKSMFETM